MTATSSTRVSLLFIFCLCFYTPLFAQLQLVSTESDPDAFIENSVNVISGSYCEAATDLVITGPDPLILQRFYHTTDYITGTQTGGWRILPERFLVIGKDPSEVDPNEGKWPPQHTRQLADGEEVSGYMATPPNARKSEWDWCLAFVGERSGGILPYSGWRHKKTKETKDALTIDIWNNASGLVNTYAKEMNGQTNHQSNQLCTLGRAYVELPAPPPGVNREVVERKVPIGQLKVPEKYELTLGDGTKRIYKKVEALPSQLLGEELTPLMAEQVADPEYFHLTREYLPSGNQRFFSYDEEGHLTALTLKNQAGKVLSWLHLTYDF